MSVFLTLGLDWGCGLGEEGHGGKVSFSSHHVKGVYYCADLDHLAEAVLVRFLHCTVSVPTLPFLYCSTVVFGRKLLCAAHT